jgi:hypothetical protein
LDLSAKIGLIFIMAAEELKRRTIKSYNKISPKRPL